ncbi:MAG: TauD/TfdA family dioxygenase [Alphaproteobacteria bacterium]
MTVLRNAPIGVHPIAGAIGAEISGVDLARPLDDETFAAVRQAFLDHLVIFFRDQTMTPDQHKAFCRRFGSLDLDRFVVPLEGHPEVLVVAKEEGERYAFGNVWHADVTFYERPPLGSVLYALEVPAYGGDTLFSNMYLAYETLSPGLKRTLEGLTAMHCAVHAYGKAALDQKFGDDRTIKIRRDREDEANLEVEHPVVRTHPDTGRKCLFVNPAYTIRFKDMTIDESKPLLSYLYDHAMRPEFTCRFRWSKGAVAFWDNRCAWHRSMNDYQGHRRIMHRVTINGDRPALR